MNIIAFNNVHFSYPPVEGDIDENGNQIQSPVVFDHFSAELPSGFVSLVGPNGSGKSLTRVRSGYAGQTRRHTDHAQRALYV